VILDTSAIVAIIFREPEQRELLWKIDDAPLIGIGAPTLVEASIVLTAKLGASGRRHLSLLLERAGAIVISFDSAHAQLAAEAWLRFGKGQHPARLNFGDCCAYATARLAGRPLLCKGADFSMTDLALA